MACLQSFDPVLGGPPMSSKNSSHSLKEDSKDERMRRHQQQDACESHSNSISSSEFLESSACAASQRLMWVERQGDACHRTFIATGDRYEMVSLPCRLL